MTSSDTGVASTRWEPPALAPGRSRGAPAPAPAEPDRDELERLRREARDAGYAEGLAAGRARMEESAQELSQLVDAFAHPFRASDAALLHSLVDLVERVVRAVLQREPAAGIDLEPVLRDALAALDEGSGRIEIHLHPDDKSLLESIDLGLDAELVADAAQQRGGLILRSGPSTVDATLETRLGEAMATLRDAAGVPGRDDAGQPDDGEAGDARGS